jgi:hypothetical protein
MCTLMHVLITKVGLYYLESVTKPKQIVVKFTYLGK